MYHNHAIQCAALFATVLLLLGCYSQEREWVLFDERSSSNIKYTVDYKNFPQDHWAYEEVKDSGLNEVVVIIREHDEGQSRELICENDGFAHYLLAEKIMDSGIYERLQFWRPLSRKNVE